MVMMVMTMITMPAMTTAIMMTTDNDDDADDKKTVMTKTTTVTTKLSLFSTVRARCYLPRVAGRPSKTRAPTPTHCTAL